MWTEEEYTEEILNEDEEENTERDQQLVNPENIKTNELICFENLLLSGSNTVKLMESDISMEDIKILKDVPGVNIFIFIDQDIKDIDKQCCDMMNNEEKDINLYSIMFINESLAKEISDEYNLDITSQNILKKEDIESEASTIISGQDD